jgi:hypothetical protein
MFFKELQTLSEIPSLLTNKAFNKIVFIHSPAFVPGSFFMD